MSNAADPRMRLRTAERLAVDHLTGRALYEVGATEPHEGSSLHHEDHVGQRREIRTARDALTHHRGDLRNPQVTPHYRVVIEDAARPELARKYATLVRQIHTRGVDQIDDRDGAAHRDFLGAQNLPDRLRPPRTRLDGRVV